MFIGETIIENKMIIRNKHLPPTSRKCIFNLEADESSRNSWNLAILIGSVKKELNN